MTPSLPKMENKGNSHTVLGQWGSNVIKISIKNFYYVIDLNMYIL